MTKPKKATKRVDAMGEPDDLVRDKAGVMISHSGKDRGPMQRVRNHGLMVEDHKIGKETVRAVRASMEPLDRYASRGEISRDQWRAGVRLKSQWRAASIECSVIADYGETIGGMSEMSDRTALARVAYREAIQAVGIILSPILLHVVCFGGAAGEWAAMRGMRGRAKEVGITTLRLALDALAHHYGYFRRA